MATLEGEHEFAEGFPGPNIYYKIAKIGSYVLSISTKSLNHK